MRGIAFYFFLSGAICVTLGMIWGLQMSATEDHLLAGAHAHLNLVGWVTLGLFGIYYHLTPQAAGGTLAKIHLATALAGVIIMVPGIAMAIRGQTPAPAIIGSLLTFASMLIFLVTILRNGFGVRT